MYVIASGSLGDHDMVDLKILREVRKGTTPEFQESELQYFQGSGSQDPMGGFPQEKVEQPPHCARIAIPTCKGVHMA